MSLELQSAYKFGLTVALGIAAVWVSMPVAGAALLLIIAVVLAGRCLEVLAADGQKARAVRPREHANWDGTLAAALAVLAVVMAAGGAGYGALVAGAAAVCLAGLRLRTRYVAGR